MNGPSMGRRRIDRVLSDAFCEGLADLDDDTLLRRRDDAIQEETDVSYVRRLIQGRLDLLRFEQQCRTEGESETTDEASDDAALVKALVAVLSDKPAAAPRVDKPAGMRAVPLRETVAPSVGGMSRRSAEAAVADVRFSNLKQLSDDELTEAVKKFEALERETSQMRSRVQRVADTLAVEVEQRVEQGRLAPTSI